MRVKFVREIGFAKRSFYHSTLFVLSCTVLVTLPFSQLEKSISRRPKGYTEQPKTIGEHLIKYRIDHKLKRIEVAKLLGVVPSVITDWEKGKYQPEAGHLKNIIAFIAYIPKRKLLPR